MKIWKTITIKKVTAQQLEKAGYKVSDWAKDLLSKTKFKKETLNLVNISVAELGFPDGATRQQIYDKAKELGLEFCPASVGPVLRMEYQDQPNGERLLIGMEPVTVSVGNLRVFGVERDDGDRWLNRHYDDPEDVWDGRNRWVFSLSKLASGSLDTLPLDSCRDMEHLEAMEITRKIKEIIK